MDFDPRDYDGRERDGRDRDDDRIYGWGEDPRERDGRERDLDPRDRDPRDPFVEGLDLPRGPERELVIDDREREYELNGEDSRMLATIGAFRVVPERDLKGFRDAEHTLEHLREEGLIHAVQIGPDDRADVLTDRGWDLLEANRRERDDDGHDPRDDDRQEFHAGVARERELQHDADLFRVYLKVEDRLRDQGADIERVILEVDLRREYQEWLQEHNRGRSDSDGRPDRTDREIEEWAREHDLYFDGKVHFPDFQIEYELEGRDRHENVEVTTGHYRGAHAASRAKAGFTCVRGGRSGGGGTPFDPDYAEDLV
ncbi:MAG: hypothetical protein HY657_12460 [Acidobacteria bacterium]|nr:hypothetical protein [Acidobacteriota bacterium]